MALQYQEAMDAFLEARRLAERLEDRKMIGILSLNLSNLYLHRYALEEAIAAVNEADAMIGTASEPWLHTKVLIQRARLIARQGDIHTAVGIYSELIADALDRGDPVSEAQAWEHLGLELLWHGDLPRSEEALIHAFRIRKLRKDKALAASYHSLSLLRLAQGDARSALALAGRALAEWPRLPAVRPLWQLRLAHGRALAALGRVSEAISGFDQALDQIRVEGAELVHSDALRINYGAGTYDAYAARIEASADAGIATANPALIEQAFQLTEEARARSLQQAIGRWEKLRRRLPPEYYRVLTQLQAAQADVMQSDSPSARARLAETRRRLTEIEVTLGGGQRDSPRTLETRIVRERMRAEDAFFSFYLGRQRSYAWLLTRESLKVWPLPGGEAIGNRIAGFVADLRTGDQKAANSGLVLFEMLFGGAGREVASKYRWLLSLEGELLDLPFPALVARKQAGLPVYLIEQHSITLVPGFWSILTPKSRALSESLLALGDAVYNAADPRWRGPKRTQPLHLSRLVGSAREIRSCAGLWEGPAKILEGPGATWNSLQTELANQRPAVLHIAAHYVPSPEHRGQTVLALGLNPEGIPQFIGQEQIAALDSHCRLVVMSGCGSGNGRTLAGEGRVGLARAWLMGGANSVIATYWPTLDDSGSLLERFYRLLRHSNGQAANPHPSDVLREAQLGMIRSRSWQAEPRYWASHFVIAKN
jgi:tetratricopeptide (TPR) repeat protein